MTYDYSTGSSSTSEGTSTAQTARDEASNVAHSAAESGKYLAGEAGAQAKTVAAEAGRQAKDLLDLGRSQLTSTAGDQQQRLAGGLRTFSSDLSQMADGAESSLASGIARTVADQTSSIASWFENREPADILDEVKRFARRNPGTFLLIAAGAGLLAGRLTRGVRDASSDTSDVAGYSSATTTGGYGLADTTPTQSYGTTGSYGAGTTGAGAAYGAQGTGYDAPPPPPAPAYPTSSDYGTTGTTGSYGTPASGTGAYGDGGGTYGTGPTYGEGATTGTTPLDSPDGGTASGDPLAGVESEERWTEENR